MYYCSSLGGAWTFPAFHDAVALRYGWDPSCGARFSLNIHKGEFPTIRHNEIRDVTANLLTEVCHEVQVEPGLQPISGERFQQASLNIEDGGFGN